MTSHNFLMTTERVLTPTLETSDLAHSQALIIYKRIVCNLRRHLQSWGLSFLSQSHFGSKRNGAQLRKHSHHVLMSCWQASAASPVQKENSSR